MISVEEQKDIMQKTKISVKNIKEYLPKVKENILLKDHTTWRIGGPAKYFLEAANAQELTAALQFSREATLPYFILGGGSNILASDKGFKGLVIKIRFLDLEIKEEGSKIKVLAGAGLQLGFLCNKLMEGQATGMEWAASIPGTLGGAVFGNAGAFGPSMADSVEWVEVLEIKNKKCEIKKYQNSDCRFAYRSSVFKKKAPNFVVIRAQLSLAKGDKEAIAKKMKEHADFRRDRHPLNFPSAGSVFKNYGKAIKNKELLAEFPELEKFNARKDIPAGWLIARSGLTGKQIGQAQISEKHSNFFVNLGGAKAKDIRALIKFAQKKVKKVFGMILEEEVIYL